MEFSNYLIEATVLNVINQHKQVLIENVNEYLALVVAKLKNHKDPFNAPEGQRIDLDHLANVVVGLKILGDSDFRQPITKKDIGFNPTDPKDLFNFLNKIDKLGKDPVDVEHILQGLAKIAPSAIKKQQDEFNLLKSGTPAQKQAITSKLEAFMHKVTQIFGAVNKAKNSGKSGETVVIPSLAM